MKYRDIECGKNFTCFVTDHGEVHMVGKGEFEKSKNGEREIYAVPYPILLELEICSVACGPSHIVALDFRGKAFSMGNGNFGCLGLGDSKDRLKFCPIIHLEYDKIMAISCGKDFTVFLVEDTNKIRITRLLTQSSDQLKNFVKLFKDQNIKSLRASEKQGAKNEVIDKINKWTKKRIIKNTSLSELKREDLIEKKNTHSKKVKYPSKMNMIRLPLINSSLVKLQR